MLLFEQQVPQQLVFPDPKMGVTGGPSVLSMIVLTIVEFALNMQEKRKSNEEISWNRATFLSLPFIYYNLIC